MHVVDSQSQAGNLASSINIVASPSLTNPPPPGGAVSVPYSTTLTVTGGVGPFSWVIDSGNLPNGLSLGASSGNISGTPTVAGTFGFDVLVTDANGQTADEFVAISISAAPSIDSGVPGQGELGAEYRFFFSAPWTRQITLNNVQDTANNLADFNFVSVAAGVISGVQSVLGAPAPYGLGDPSRNNPGFPSTLLDTGRSSAEPPNRVITKGVGGQPGTVVVRRTVTNTTGATITSANVRITAISEPNGRPPPGAPQNPPKQGQPVAGRSGDSHQPGPPQ